MNAEKKVGIYVVIPAHNEEKVIAEVVKGVLDKGYSCVVVDDGSKDNTYLEAQKTGAKVFRHRINRGKGAAVLTGIEAAIGLEAQIIATMDGDGQHDIIDLDRLIEPIKSGNYEVVLGSRILDVSRSKFPLWRLLANHIGNAVTFILCGIWVSDSQSGFRAYSARVARLLEQAGDKYEFDSEVIRIISRHKCRYKEVPISVHYTEYSLKKVHGQSFQNGLKTFWRLIWNIIS